MHPTGWLILASLLAPTLVFSQQQDTSFTNVEYLDGMSAMEKKQKGTLVVSREDVRLVDKKKNPYFIIPLAIVQEVTDSTPKEGLTKKASSGLLKKAGLGGLLGGPVRLMTIVTKNDSGVTAAVEFKIHEPDAQQLIISRIKSELSSYKLARQAGGNPAAAGASSAPGAAGGAAAGATPPASSPTDTAPATPPATLRLIVANPFTAAAADSGSAVEIGTAVRTELSKLFGANLQIVTREQMNEALKLYGYPSDAILDSALAMTLAKTLQASALVSGKLSKGDDGQYSVTANLATVDGAPGNPVTVVQKSGESLADYGRRIAEALK